MTFSIGQNFFNDLLQTSDKITHNDQKAISLTYDLQTRLAHYFQNNEKVVLLKSEEYCGGIDLFGNCEPLGGSINWLRCGTDNLPSSCKDGCPDEFDFWGMSKESKSKIKPDKKENFENINKVVEQPEIIENFTVDDVLGHKENFGDITPIVTVVCIILFIGLIILCYFMLTRPKNNNFL